MKRKFLLLVMMCLLGGVYTSEIKAQFNVTYNQGAANQYILTFTPLDGDGNTCSVQMNKGNGPSAATDLVIPATIEHQGTTYTVVKIPNNAFSGDSRYLGAATDYFTSLTIPNTVTTIGSYAFRYWENCTTVTLGEGVTSISNNAFANSNAITTIYCYAETLPTCGGNAVFTSTVENDAKLYVPSSSLQEYQKEVSSGSGSGWAYIRVINISALSTTPTAPTAPTLNSPKDGPKDIFNPSLDFTLGNSTTHYQILMAEASGTNTGEYSILQDWTKKTDNDVSYQTSHLKPNTTYSWKVKARNGEGYDAPTTESTPASFTTRNITEAPGKITEVYLADGTDVYPAADGASGLKNPSLSWKFGKNTEEFQLLLGQDKNNLQIVSNGEWENTRNTTAPYTYTPSSLSSGTYYWQVNTRNTVGQETYNTTTGDLYSFSVVSIPDDITPIYPTDGATGISKDATISWTFSRDTKQYRVLYYLAMYDGYDPMTDWLDVDQNTFTASIETSSWGITAGQTVKWCVEVKNDIGGREIYTSDTKKAEPKKFTYTTANIFVSNNKHNSNEILEGTTANLSWEYDGTISEYQVLVGTTNPPTDIVQDWTEAAGTGGSLEYSLEQQNVKYYWQVKVRNNEETAESSILSFVSLKRPEVNPVANLYPGSNDAQASTTISWKEITGASYKIYYGNEVIDVESTSYELSGLSYNNGEANKMTVAAVYDGLGESFGTEVNIYVSGYASVSGKITNKTNDNNIAGAIVRYAGTTDLGDEFTSEFTTNADGTFSGNIPYGTYTMTTSATNYQDYSGTEKTYEEGTTYNKENAVLTPNLPDNATPISPAEGATGVTSNVVRFQFAPNTEEYRLLYDRGYGFEYVNDENWVLTNNATTAEFEFPELEHSSTYYWAVDVKNDLGQRTVYEGGEEINTYSFTTNSILPVKYTSSKDDQITDVNTTLTWTYKGSAEKYQVLLGTTNPPTDIVQDWTEVAGTGGSFEATGLSNARYYWQVNVKSGEETVIYGDVMSFISLKKPGVPTVSQTKNPTTEIDPTSETTIAWNALEGVQGYNVYLGTKELNAEILSAEETSYTIAANTLQYNMNPGYDISVEAVYELGTSMSEAVNVKVTGTGLLNAKIRKSFNTTLGVDSATITLTRTKDEFENVYEGNGKKYTFTTNAEGECNESVLNGTYKVEVSRKYYDTKTIDSVVFKQGETTNLSDSDVIPYVRLKADSTYVFEVLPRDISFNSINIYLENSEWETAPEGHYIVYLKNGDNIEKILTPNQDNPNPWFSSFGVESIRYEYDGWADLSKGSYQFGVAKAEDQINWSATVERNYAVFVKDGNWSDENNWNDNIVPDADDEVYVRAAATIAEGEAITAGEINIENDGSLTINGSLTADVIYKAPDAAANAVCLNDGGQLRQGNAELSGVFNMNIATPTNWNNTTNKDGWQFIASPFTDAKVEAWTTGNYDFYKYDGTQQLEWINEKDGINEDFEKVFVQGRGYLASRESESENITLSGTFNNATSYTWKGLTYNEANDPNDPSSQNLANFYLLGNPFTFNMDMTKASYNNLIEGVAIVNAEGGYTYVGVNQETTTIPVGDGFFVKVKEPQNATDVISLSYPARSSREKSSSINLVATSKAGQDNVVINFDGQAEGFDKLQNFNDEIATVCVVENDKAYGIYNCDSDVNEIEVTFVAKQMDSYSLSFNIKGEFETVTLVDRMTGVETDMIEESEYSFIATSKDMKNRFVVRLTNGQQPTANSQFVYQSGEELILSIEGSVQIVDMMGRVVYSAEHSNGSNRISVSEFNNAAYVVRVVNGNGVKTQKVVIY